MTLPLLFCCNIWDNIFSKNRGIPNIDFKEKFSTTFNLTAQDKNYTVDFSYDLPQLRINADVESIIDVLGFRQKIPVARAEINAGKNLIVVTVPLVNSCNNYELGLMGNFSKENTTSKVIGSYMETFFEYTEMSNKLYVFNFSPNLVNSFEEDVPEVKIYTDSRGQIQEIRLNGKEL